MTRKPTYEELEQRVRELEIDAANCKRAEEEIKRHSAQLATLHETSAAVSSRLALEEIFETVVKGLSEGFDYRLIGIHLIEEGMLELKAHAGYSSPPDHSLARVPLKKGVIGRTARTGQPQLVTRVEEDPDFFYGAPGITSEVCVPLKKGDEVLGVLSVENDRVNKTLDTSDMQLLVLLSNYIVIAIENARLYDAAQQELAERKQAEEALRESEETARALLTATTDSAFLTDPDGIVIATNNLAAQRLDKSMDEFIGKCAWDFFPPETEKKIRAHVDRLIRSGKPVHYEEERKGLFLYNSIFPILDTGGKVERIAFFARDITKIKRAEEGLRESERFLTDVFESIQDGISVLNTDLTVRRVNGVMKQWYAENLPLEGKKCHVCYHNSNKPCYPCPTIRCFQSGQTEREIVRGLPGSHVEWIELFSYPIKDRDSGKVGGVVEFARDITQEKKLEEQLQQAQKMEALGTLAGGIAHDFNNLLMGIQGRTSLVLMDKDSSHLDFEHLKGIEEYVKSAADLTRQLLGLARGGKYEVRQLDLNEIVKKTSGMFGRTKKEINIHKKYQKDIWTVEADQGQIEQILVNLYVNAWQAMPGGGELYLGTENVTLGEDYVKPFSVEPGKYVKISIADTGVGMDEATKQKIFEPFFTTKERGMGTGLGLASVYGITKNHGGFIYVNSEKGKGTEFNIYLPASEKGIIRGEKLAEGLLKGTETILLIDDEDMIIDVGKQFLETLGYNVLIAKSGKEAIEIYKANKEQIDIIILDMIMPDMGGSETYDKLKKINVGIKVLLSSGYSVEGEATEILNRGCNGFIQKPFNIKQISQSIRKILES